MRNKFYGFPSKKKNKTKQNKTKQKQKNKNKTKNKKQKRYFLVYGNRSLSQIVNSN